MMKYDTFMQSLDEARIVRAIQEAEGRTTGEIRLCVARDAEPDAMKAAREAFGSLGMERTRDRNGVLILIAPASQTFAILGDQGIDQRCGGEFWAELTRDLAADFAAGRSADGLEKVIARVGERLADQFPRDPGDSNELPDSVTTV